MGSGDGEKVLTSGWSIVWTPDDAGPVGTGRAEPRPVAPTAPFPLPPPQLFGDAIRLAVSYKQNSQDFMDEVLQELEVGPAQMSGGIERTASPGRGAELAPQTRLGKQHILVGMAPEVSEPHLGTRKARPHLLLVHRTST